MGITTEMVKVTDTTKNNGDQKENKIGNGQSNGHSSGHANGETNGHAEVVTPVVKTDDSVFRTAAAKWLNEFRDIYEYPKIAIDDKLTKEAGLYAQHLVDTTYYKRAPVEELNGAGECLYASRGGEANMNHMKLAIESWIGEKRQFSWDSKPLKGNNYSEVMWKSAKKIGLGIAYSKKGWVFVVGRVFPAGNVKGQFYNNLPTSEPRKQMVAQNKQNISRSASGRSGSTTETAPRHEPASDTHKSKRDNNVTSWANNVQWPTKRFTSSENESPENKVKSPEKKVTWPEKSKDLDRSMSASSDMSNVSYESTDNGQGYRGSFSSSSFVIEDDGPEVDPFDRFYKN